MIDITEIRKDTHGSFSENALFSQSVKELMRTHANGWAMLNNQQREALDMIALKISRILSGKANNQDHWIDIEGYAILGRKSCTTS